ncbi:tRNA (adenosine(37)-N6)-dimethylallyltransferase MiaA [Aequorivita viscosa]|uniref:tRNA dimethylallyltransferase n=1 Tax=Aequorivita viscosa TaxID=797419 RepID=A0A1M6ITS8_9FLAO|nr:tRNA (adenosine(37)-N6)-dimethylallyltransferase MiaA [Aequorivita viscosa]SDX14196.1 tRNA dimethylallyltransferase [Aequorivita viscosa]SHJ37841.1 tRNA dimethylallyltransferase [Aequorivita viscosa]
MRNKPLLVCVVGPTAIGKTSLAIELANAFNTEIISADSRQFYKEMSIGTAVPSEDELKAAPHHFIQSKSIFEDYSVGDFERDALTLITEKFNPTDADIEKRSTLVMVGGSGLYVDAVVKGLDKFPEVPAEIRDNLNVELQKFGIEHLQEKLKNADPNYYSKVDIQNPHRLIRALEIYMATGRPYSSFLTKENTIRDFETIFIGITAEREIVYARINERVDRMIDAGLIEEARSLYAHREKNALQTVGYRELFSFFDGTLSIEEAISEIKKNTRRFAKRQGTWFKKNERIHWFDYQTCASEIVAFINEKNAI